MRLTQKNCEFKNHKVINGRDLSKVRAIVKSLFSKIGIPLENETRLKNGKVAPVCTRPNPTTMKDILEERGDKELALEDESKRPTLYEMFISKDNLIKAYDICFRQKYNEVYNLKVKHANKNDNTVFEYDELYCALAEFAYVPFKFIIINDVPDYVDKFDKVYNYFNKKYEFK